MAGSGSITNKIALIGGDGIGPEVVEAVHSIGKELTDIKFEKFDCGYEYFCKTGKVIEAEDWHELKKYKYILFGAAETPEPKPKGFYTILVNFRTDMDLYANIRPIHDHSTGQLILTVIKQNTEGLYFQPEYYRGKDTVIAEAKVSRLETEKVTHAALDWAQQHKLSKITVSTKSNVLELSDGLFKKVAEETIRVREKIENYPIELVYEYIDATCYNAVKNPGRYQVILTSSLYGDILSDVTGNVAKSLGTCGSICKGPQNMIAEPVHGSAPDIAGKGLANPMGALYSFTYLLDEMGQQDISRKIKSAISVCYKAGQVTQDLGGNLTTSKFVDAIIKAASEL